MQQKSLYIVAYDIPQDNRRNKLHKLLCGYGNWTQYSLFECWLTAKQKLELYVKIERLIDESDDTVRIYPLCRTCVHATITLGGDKPKETTVYLI